MHLCLDFCLPVYKMKKKKKKGFTLMETKNGSKKNGIPLSLPHQLVENTPNRN